MRHFPGSPVVKTLCFQMQGMQVWSLVMELRSHLPNSQNQPTTRESTVWLKDTEAPLLFDILTQSTLTPSFSKNLSVN